jgi:hypothetical protein
MTRKLRLKWTIVSVGAVFGANVIVSADGRGQQPMIKSGALTCTVSDVPGSSNGSIELACDFKSQAGASGDYVGSADTKSSGLPPAKHVFLWSVVTTDAGKALSLEGTFTAEAGRQGPAVLIGGRNGSVRLEPVTNKELAGPADITMLTLKLAATKT